MDRYGGKRQTLGCLLQSRLHHIYACVETGSLTLGLHGLIVLALKPVSKELSVYEDSSLRWLRRRERKELSTLEKCHELGRHRKHPQRDLMAMLWV